MRMAGEFEKTVATADEAIAKLSALADSKARAYAVAVIMSHFTEQDPAFISNVAFILERSLEKLRSG